MYSNAVKVGGLTDYLAPAEECILPLIKNPEGYEIKLNDRRVDSEVPVRPENANNPLANDIYSNNRLKVERVDRNKRITVGLSDCLSCSGCLTTSEEVLLRDDNCPKVVEKLREAEFAVVSISPQTIFMFAGLYDIPAQTVLRRLSSLFRSLGAKMVFDLGLAELLALQRSKEEFVARYRARSRATPPVITSHCPGVTLYAEKTLEQELVGMISGVPSSHVIQGLLVKVLVLTLEYLRQVYPANYARLLNPGWGPGPPSTTGIIGNFIAERRAVRAYHVCVVPCYDKKLEIVRDEFRVGLSRMFPHADFGDEAGHDDLEPLVDDVLSTGDVAKILDTLNSGFDGLGEAEVNYLHDYTYVFNKFAHLPVFQRPACSKDELDDLYSLACQDPAGDRLVRCAETYSQSGGFAEEVFKHAAKTLFGRPVSGVRFAETLNPDLKECVLRDGDTVLLRFLIAYGFRNIQNVVKLLRAGGGSAGTSGYDYIELMSCPGGCFNGAGQLIEYAERSLQLPARVIAAVARLLPAKYSGLLRPRTQTVDLRAAVAAAEARFLAEAEYVPAGDPTCRYFEHVLGMLQDALGLELRLKSHGGTKQDIKW